MLRFVKFLLLLPPALALVLFGVANRQLVTLVLDPISPASQAMTVTVPLFALFFGTLAVGIVVGWVGAWLSQGRHRRAERQLRRERDRLESENARLRNEAPGPALLSSR